MASSPASSVDRSLILRHPSFYRFWVGQLGANSGFQMLSVAIGWQLYDMTHRPLDLGLVGLAEFLPVLLLTLPAGHVADRCRRRSVVSICYAVEAAICAAFFLSSATGTLDPALVYTLAAILGAARAFASPAASALLPTLVARDMFGHAQAWSSSVFHAASIAGPALGGLLYGLGPEAAYMSCAALFALGAVMAGSLPAGAVPSAPEGSRLASVFAGLSFIRRERAILGTISLDLFAVLLGGATALLPIYARDILGTGPVGLGLLRAAPALGALAVALHLARRPLQHQAGIKMLAAVIIFGLGTCVFALSRNFFVSLAALLILGAGDMVSVFIRHSLVQLRTPDAMRGRVSAVNSIFIGASNQLGEFESGLTADLFGVVPAALLGGIGTLAVVGLWSRLFPELRKVDRLDGEG